MITLYPRLIPFDGMNGPAREPVPLSRHALVNGGQPMFLLDRNTEIILYLSATSADFTARPAKESTFNSIEFKK